MTFKPGKYRTRDGRDAIVLCNDAPGDYPLVGYIIGEGARSWTPCGSGGSVARSGDLMPPEPEQVVRWVNLYRNGFSVHHETYRDALESCDRPGDLVARARVMLGQFDDENTPDPYTKGWNEALEEACAQSYNGCIGVNALRALKRSAP